MKTMKNQILTWCMFLIFNMTFAQVYHSFPDSNSVWSVDLQKFLINGDSILNLVSYKKYYNTLDTNLTTSSLQFVGLVRSDTLNRKVYGIIKNQSTEKIMYDFNLNLNDSISVYSIGFGYSSAPNLVKVYSKDSILINGQYRKRLRITGYSNSMILTEDWIEGIGSTFGPLNSGISDLHYVDICYPTLLCQKQNGILNYINPTYNSCYYNPCWTGINEIFSDDNVLVYPNPSKNIITIKTKDQIKNISVFNSFGQLVDNANYNINAKTLNLSNFPNGIYLLKIIMTNKTIEKKIIVNSL